MRLTAVWRIWPGGSDGSRKQALHPIGMGLPSVFSDLPAIFARDLADEGLQVQEGMPTRLGAGKVGSQALMQLAQGQRPAADFGQAGSDLRRCALLFLLHVFLVSDGRLEQWDVLGVCHI